MSKLTLQSTEPVLTGTGVLEDDGETPRHYHMLFDNVPIALVEFDFSEARQKLASSSPSEPDQNGFFAQNPQALADLIACLKLVRINQIAARLMGTKDQKDFLKQFVNLLFLPQFQEFFREFLQVLARGQNILNGDISFMGAGQKLRHWAVDFILVKETGRENLLMFGRDITARLELEKELGDKLLHYICLFEGINTPLVEISTSKVSTFFSEAFGKEIPDFRARLEQSPECLTEFFDQIYISETNPAALALFKAETPQELKARWQHALGDESLPVLKQAILDFAEGKNSFVSDIKFRTLTGEPLEVIISISRLSDPATQRPLLLVSFQDITERERTAAKLREAQRRIECMVAAIPSILIRLDADGVITHWNPVAEQTFGIRADQVVGRAFSESGVQWDWPYFFEQLLKIGGLAVSGQIRNFPFTRPDGAAGFLDLVISPIANSGEETGEVLLLGTDITQNKSLESQLLQAQKLESIGQLAAGIAHEINTPTQYVGDNLKFLQQVQEGVKLLRASVDDLLAAGRQNEITPALIAKIEKTLAEADIPYLADELPKAIQQSLEGVARVTAIVRAMKDFAHPDSAEKAPVNLNEAIASTATIARNEWKYVADLTLDLDPGLPAVQCYGGEFNQVMLNLIVNAAHAIGEAVDGGKKGKGRITITTRRRGTLAEIRVADTGTGIPDHILPRIFDPFFTTKKVGKGTGQGLTITRNIVVGRHKGNLRVETQMGKGTTFILEFPFENSPESQAAPETGQP